MNKYLLISGSPRKGNTEFILSEIYKNINGKKELVLLKNLDISYCKGCLSCYSKGKCIHNDDMKVLLKKMFNTDLIIIGSPLYYGNVSGMMKNFIDRTIPAYESQFLKDKKIISIMVGGGKTSVTAKFHKEAIKGFVKYNKLKLIKMYNFEALEANDLKKKENSKKQIEEIVKKVNLIST